MIKHPLALNFAISQRLAFTGAFCLAIFSNIYASLVCHVHYYLHTQQVDIESFLPPVLRGGERKTKVRRRNSKRHPDDISTVNLTVNNILWTKNWGRHVHNCNNVPEDYYTQDTMFSLRPNEIEDLFSGCRGNIWLRNSLPSETKTGDITHFIDRILPKMTQNFTLITTDGFRHVPSNLYNYEKLLESPLLQRWHAQNFDGTVSDSRIKVLPIGFDLHTKWEGMWSHDDVSINIKHMLDLRRKGLGENNTRIDEPLIPPMVFQNHRDRRIAVDSSRKCFNKVHDLSFKPINILWEEFTKYKFSLSPHGRGLDCHRTWEMLFFGIIPIVKTSSLDPLYENLPVIIVDEWDDVCKEDFSLEQEYERIKDFWPAPLEVFTTDYWLQKQYD